MHTLQFSGEDSYIRIRIVQQINPILQFQKDIFDLKTLCELLSFIWF